MDQMGKTLFSKDKLLNMVSREVKHNQSKPGLAIMILDESYFLKGSFGKMEKNRKKIN